jgi:hypothetical protein
MPSTRPSKPSPPSSSSASSDRRDAEARLEARLRERLGAEVERIASVVLEALVAEGWAPPSPPAFPAARLDVQKGHVGARLDRSTIARLDALLPLHALPGRKATRSDVLRAVIFAGIEVEEQQAAGLTTPATLARTASVASTPAARSHRAGASDHVAVRLDPSTIARLDALLPLHAQPGREATRVEVLRAVILAGIEVEEQRAAGLTTPAAPAETASVSPGPAVLFDAARAGGAESVRRLLDLPIKALQRLVSELGYDPARQMRKWKDRDRLLNFIADETVKRVRRNQAFQSEPAADHRHAGPDPRQGAKRG